LTRRTRRQGNTAGPSVTEAEQEAERIVTALERELGARGEPDRSKLLAAISKAHGKPLDKGLTWDLRQAWPGRPERDITRRYEQETL